jgi:hypothetical protein
LKQFQISLLLLRIWDYSGLARGMEGLGWEVGISVFSLSLNCNCPSVSSSFSFIVHTGMPWDGLGFVWSVWLKWMVFSSFKFQEVEVKQLPPGRNTKFHNQHFSQDQNECSNNQNWVLNANIHKDHRSIQGVCRALTLHASWHRKCMGQYLVLGRLDIAYIRTLLSFERSV